MQGKNGDGGLKERGAAAFWRRDWGRDGSVEEEERMSGCLLLARRGGREAGVRRPRKKNGFRFFLSLGFFGARLPSFLKNCPLPLEYFSPPPLLSLEAGGSLI